MPLKVCRCDVENKGFEGIEELKNQNKELYTDQETMSEHRIAHISEHRIESWTGLGRQ